MYEVFLRHVLPEPVDDMPLCIRRQMWFQEDGAPAHTSENVRQYLDHTFPNIWIGRYGPVPWPARSSDLTPSDFYLYGHMKSLIYETPVESEMNLVERIVDAARLIVNNPRIFDRVRESLDTRPALTYRVDILNNYCKFNSVVQFIS